MSQYLSTNPEQRQLLLVKKDQRWVFRYTLGQEQLLLQCLADTARDDRQDFDWFDASVLSHRMGDHLSEQLKQLMGSSC